MRSPRGSFIPATRIYDHEREVIEDNSGLTGYSMADFVRAALGLEPEHLPKGKSFKEWSVSPAGTLLYCGRIWKGNVSQLLNERCVIPKER